MRMGPAWLILDAAPRIRVDDGGAIDAPRSQSPPSWRTFLRYGRGASPVADRANPPAKPETGAGGMEGASGGEKKPPAPLLPEVVFPAGRPVLVSSANICLPGGAA